MKDSVDFLKKDYKVDYHIHTPHSDGHFGVADIIRHAQDNEVKEISLTDHDSIDVYKTLKPLNNLKIISGVEVSVVVDDIRIEILGYGFDVKKLKKFKFLNNKYRREVFQKVLDKLIKKANENGAVANKVRIDEYPLLSWSLYNEISSHIENIEFIKKHKLTNNFNRILNDKNFIFYTHPEHIVPSVEEAARYIREAGGIVVLAHPYKYKKYYNGMDGLALCKYLFSKKLIDGIEVAHSAHSLQEIKKLYNFAKKNNLICTFGSDYHGNLTWDKYDCEVGRLTELGIDSIQTQQLIISKR